MTKIYYISVPVSSVEGFQVYSIKAESKKDALDRWDKDGEFVEEDLSVMDLGGCYAEIIGGEEIEE